LNHAVSVERPDSNAVEAFEQVGRFRVTLPAEDTERQLGMPTAARFTAVNPVAELAPQLSTPAVPPIRSMSFDGW
jgi:hypothetical protein